MAEIKELINLSSQIHVADIGAAYIAETPVYRALLDRGIAHLSAFDADDRHRDKLAETYGKKAKIVTAVLGDGQEQTLYLAAPASGMTSILKPSAQHLRFFNGFSRFGKIESTVAVQTSRLDDLRDLEPIDFLKMDIQGAELSVLKSGAEKLRDCVAIQLEVSFVPLYENQPSFGDIDVWMRQSGFMPHRFVDVKRWSITPTIRENNFRKPFNQLLEADIVYVKDCVNPGGYSIEQLWKLAHIALYCYDSIDLAVHLLLELEKRGRIKNGEVVRWLSQKSKK